MTSKAAGSKRKSVAVMKKSTTSRLQKSSSSFLSQPSGSPSAPSVESSAVLHSQEGIPSVVESTPLEGFNSEEGEVKVLSDEEYLTLLASRSRADVWNHYTRKCIDGRVKAVCKWCKTKEYFADSGTNGTRNLRSHIETCMKYPPNQEKRAAKGQTILGFRKNKEAGKHDELYAVGFSQVEVTKACVQMVILDELPFSFVEGEGFSRFCLRACPEWRVPCRQTIAKEVLPMYYHDKEQLKSELSLYRVCLTTDTWTSIHNINYMVVTAHYIDAKWVIHKKVLNFCLIPNHKGESIGRLLEECVAEWGLKRISTIIVDNASKNDAGLRDFIKRVSDWDDADVLLHEGENLHMRCVAHILNRIVNDGLTKMKDCIQNIRSAVRYVRSSPQRLTTFKKCVEKEKIESKGLVVLDVPTRWNSTYLMLLSTLQFKKAFDRLMQDDGHYSPYFSSVGNGNTRKKPPQDGDWKIAELCANFLKPFYDVTLRVCCSNKPTIHQTFEDVFKINAHLKVPQPEDSPLVEIIGPMQKKYNAYWGDLEKMNPYFFIAMVLDPRNKLYRLIDILEVLNGDKGDDDVQDVNDKDLPEVMTTWVKDLLLDLYKTYAKDVQVQTECNEDGNSSEIPNESSSTISPTSIEKVLQEKMKKRKEKEAEVIHNEVNRYLRDAIEGDEDQSFDILNWWRVNAPSKYPILGRVAQDVIAIPVSTIASESTFSTSGRTISSFRSSLSPKMVEALICTQNWLRETYVALDLDPTSEELEFYEAIEKEIGDKGQGVMLPPKPKN